MLVTVGESLRWCTQSKKRREKDGRFENSHGDHYGIGSLERYQAVQARYWNLGADCLLISSTGRAWVWEDHNDGAG